MNAAIITARGGKQALTDKHLREVCGAPLVAWPIRAAKNAERIDSVYVSTNCPSIARVARGEGALVIDRPPELALPTSDHGLAIRHAIEAVGSSRSDFENVVVLLGNTVMVDADLIDKALEMLEESSSLLLSGVMSVWQAQDDHPMRALHVKDGYLKSYGDASEEGISTNRQSYPDVYFYDQGVWAFRKRYAFSREGPRPWWWMGPKVRPIVREWIAGRDVHSVFGLDVSEWWLARQQRGAQ